MPESAESAGGDDAASSALAHRLSRVDVRPLAEQLETGEWLLRDIVASLRRPGRDPREDLPAPVFRRGIMKLEDLSPGMELSGTVLNVVDFGAFVDIGLTDSGLIHISRLADRYVKDPHEVVSVGDILQVWVVEVDKQRRRVSLTAIRPGTEKAHERRPAREGRARGKKRSEARGGPAPRGGERGKRPRSAAGSSGGRRPPAKPKPKPVKPITKEMEEGKEPLRSFSDLMQFYEKKKEPPGK
jgi:uncharacterized protein